MNEAKDYKKYLKGLKKATESSSKKDFKVKKIMPFNQRGIQGILMSRTTKKDGGRIGLKMGSKCKLATKGKGRAYGKNS